MRTSQGASKPTHESGSTKDRLIKRYSFNYSNSKAMDSYTYVAQINLKVKRSTLLKNGCDTN